LEKERFLREALKEAKKAYEEGEVPVGALVVREGKVLARAGNKVEALKDPTAHAELLAIREACKRTGEKFLYGATLFVTLEPCVMCAYACVLARIERVVFSAKDPKHGGVMSLFTLFEEPRLNHRVVWEYYPLKEAEKLLRSFFKERR